MNKWLFFTFVLYVSEVAYAGVSTKLDFGGEDESTMTSGGEADTSPDDVEVKQTIVVSTKLINNNRKGILDSSNGKSGFINIGNTRKPKVDDTEVPIVKGYKAVDTTQIRTPDTRYKTRPIPESVFVNRNIRNRDEYDIFPNAAMNPSLWKPSSFFNNINWWGAETDNYNFIKKSDDNDIKFNRKVADDGVVEFYCKRCRELSGNHFTRPCGNFLPQTPKSSWSQTTTPKVKIDGKLAKLN